uniref:Thioredoxin domain-containing protein n=1 Tax=Strongyloides stercoralis TaxID=6248 RepID=A0A0K0ERU1_STRER
MINCSLTSLAIVIIGAATATILFDTQDSLGLRTKLFTTFSGNKETSYENLDAYNLDETGFIPTILILYAHGKFCCKFYHTHSIKCVPSNTLSLTPSRSINKLNRELNKTKDNIHNVKQQKNNENKKSEKESKVKIKHEDKLKSDDKNEKDKNTKYTDQAYIDLTTIDEDIKKAKKLA